VYRVRTIEGDYVLSKTVIIATGVSYRLLTVDGLDTLKGPGVYYGATNVESRLCLNSAIHVIGAGNSAGQAAMFLSQTASDVSLLVRGSDLRRMSSYLSERLLANNKVRIRLRTEVVAVDGVEHISGLYLRGPNGEVTREFTSGVFVFIGAKPRTDFLPSSVARTEKGFILTGPEVALLPEWKEPRQPCVVETTLPGIFAAGDCRNGTPKRVAYAIGDGASAITSVHNFFGRMYGEQAIEERNV
jgi:thioredoxin reductase (NADPH)